MAKGCRGQLRQVACEVWTFWLGMCADHAGIADLHSFSQNERCRHARLACLPASHAGQVQALVVQYMSLQAMQAQGSCTDLEGGVQMTGVELRDFMYLKSLEAEELAGITLRREPAHPALSLCYCALPAHDLMFVSMSLVVHPLLFPSWSATFHTSCNVVCS